MHFHFSRFNHCDIGRSTLEDMGEVLAGMLIDLGHTVSLYDAEFETAPSINVIFEAFGRAHVRRLKRARREGCRFIVVATERWGDKALNDLITSAEMCTRRRWLPAALKQAAAVWCLVPGTAAHLQEFCQAVDVELGYSAALAARVKALPAVEPEAMFCFYGGITQRRAHVINHFRRGGLNVIVPPEEYGPLSDRNDVLARSMVSLGLKASHSWAIVSSSRIIAALYRGRPVLMEQVREYGASPWSRIVPFVPTHDLPPAGLRMAARWREAWAEQVAAFREVLPPERCLGPALASLRPDREPDRGFIGRLVALLGGALREDRSHGANRSVQGV